MEIDTYLPIGKNDENQQKKVKKYQQTIDDLVFFFFANHLFARPSKRRMIKKLQPPSQALEPQSLPHATLQ